MNRTTVINPTGKVRPKEPVRKSIELSAAEAAVFWHHLDRIPRSVWTPLEADLYLRLRRLHNVDWDHVGRASTVGAGMNTGPLAPRWGTSIIPGT